MHARTHTHAHACTLDLSKFISSSILQYYSYCVIVSVIILCLSHYYSLLVLMTPCINLFQWRDTAEVCRPVPCVSCGMLVTVPIRTPVTALVTVTPGGYRQCASPSRRSTWKTQMRTLTRFPKVCFNVIALLSDVFMKKIARPT